METTGRLGDRDEARWVVQAASGLDRAGWPLHLDDLAGARAVARLDQMVARRLGGEPLAYVLGSWSFRTVDLLVDRRVLIPRPETELVAEVALAEARRALTLADADPTGAGAGARGRPVRVADLGTGSGAIALSLAAELPLGAAEVWATDVSPDALDVARANLAGLGRRGAQVRLAAGPWFEALPGELAGELAVVVSNPPYVAEHDDIEAAVVAWEPAGALFAGPDGLDAVRHLVSEASRWVRPGGALVLEIGSAQGEAAAELAHRAGWVEVEVRSDLAGRDRILRARRA